MKKELEHPNLLVGIQAALNRGAAHVNRSKVGKTGADYATISDYEKMADIMDQHGEHLGQMIETKEYHYSYKENKKDKTNEAKPKNGIIYIGYNKGELASQMHEENHGYQFITGDLKLNEKGKLDENSRDLSDEASSYRVGYSMMNEDQRKRFRKGIKNPAIRGVNDITSENLSNSGDYRFQFWYSDLIRDYKKNH